MEPVWYDEYSAGVPREIDAKSYSSCVSLLQTSVAKYGDKAAFANMGTELSYVELDALSCEFAAYLQSEVGIVKGDRVAIMLPNLLQYPVALFGIMRAGGLTVNVNPQYTPRELEHQLNDSGAKAIVIASTALPILQQIVANTGIETILTTEATDLLGANFGNNSGDIAASGTFLNALARGRKLELAAVDLDSEDILFLQYTGGTTGVSKGATLTHGNLVANVTQFSSWFGDALEHGEERFLSPLPLYHIFGLMVNCFCALSVGAVSVLISDPRNPQVFLDAFRDYKISFMTGVNTLYNTLLHVDGFADLDFRLKFSVGGGAAVQRVVAEHWEQATGCHIMEGYGLSETSPILTLNKTDSTAYTGSIGLPVPSTDVSLRDDAGREVALGESGELCAKGPQVMLGYWNRPESTAECMTEDGYFRTGDIATVDAQGYFRIVDRKKDMILVSGFNVFPNEIEDVVAACEGVLENACIGIPDEKSGEAIKVFAVLEPGVSLTPEQLKAHCKSHLTGYKVPKHVEFIEELPKSNVGKILRRELRVQE